MSLNVKDFGAKGNGGDDTAAFTTAINAANGDTVLVPPGQYGITYIQTANPIKLQGTGWESSVIRALTPTQNVFATSSTAPCYFNRLGFAANVIRTDGAYIKFDTTQTPNFGTRISDCNFDHAFTGVDFVDAAGWAVSGCYCTNYNIGISVANQLSPDAGDSTLTANIFDAGNTSGIAVAQWSSGGLRITNNKFLHGAYHYLGQFVSAPSNTSILLFNDNSSEAASAVNFAINSQNGTTFGLVTMDGNEFSVGTGATGVLIQDPGYAYFSSAMIGGNMFNLAANATAMCFNRGSRLTIDVNNMSGNGAGSNGIIFSPNVTSAFLMPQDMAGVTNTYIGLNSKIKMPVKL